LHVGIVRPVEASATVRVATLVATLALSLPLWARADPADQASPQPSTAAGSPPAAVPPTASPAVEPEPEDETGEPIAEVRVRGNRRIETAAILNPLKTKPGKPLSPKALRDDIRALWEMRFFDDIKADEEQGPRGPIITFIIQEKPLVHSVTVKGNEEIDEDDLKKELEVKPYQIFDADAARRTVKKLQGKYADKGFYLAEVTYTTKPAAGDNEIDVVFNVVEHAKVEVRRVDFQGNKAITDDELRSAIQTQAGTLISFLTQQGTYKEDAFQRDLLIVQSLYYNKGYVNVRVGKPSVALSADKREIYVVIPVDEGDPYDLGVIGVSGSLLTYETDVKKLVTMIQGERFGSEKLQKNMTALQDFFRDHGYAYVQVSPATNIDVAKKTIDINFVIQPGSQIYIDRIEVVGNTKTRDRVIRRELRIAEGELYNGTAIRLSKARVTALGFFEVVDITSKPGSSPTTMDLEVAVKEKSTGTFQVGLGFSNQEPILLNANVSQNNFLGWGTDAAIMAQVSNLRRIFDLSYSDPYFLDSNWTLAVDIYNTLQIYGNLFDRTAFGGTLTGGYLLAEDFRIFLTYTLQQVNVTPTSTNAVLLANRFQNGLTSSVKFSFTWDRRDNRLFPTNGFMLSGSVEEAPGKYLGGTTDFTRLIGIARFYRPLPLGLVFKVNLTAGYIYSPPTNPVPVSELFFEGGINSLRGYNFRTVAPIIMAGQNPGLPLTPLLIGGNKELLSNWELEFPIIEEAGLRGVIFFDAGNVYSDTQRFFDPTAPGAIGLLMSVGFGARWFTPLGPLRFEWGFALTPRPIDVPPNSLQFTIGNFF
jgi:outer membrane protein insertion porin family